MSIGLTAVMYHYVRDLRRSRFPAIKGLLRDEFDEQIRYIKRHYNVISGETLMAAIAGDTALPPRAVLLTFDDGYADHFAEVYPVLERERLPGCFFPPARCVLDHVVLDVNKIQFVLASTPETGRLVEHITRRIDESRAAYALRSSAEYWNEFATSSRYDPADVMFCKRMLQRELPLELRQRITDELFARFVTADEVAFSRELYMTPHQLSTLSRQGMYIGSHGYDHFWLDTLSTQQQECEIDLSLEFLRGVGAQTERWIMCYPYGAYNESLLDVLRARGCVAGLTTEVGLAALDTRDPLTLPRLDTNDLPKQVGAPAADWTLAAAG